MPDPVPHRCPMPTTEAPAPSAICSMPAWISSKIAIACLRHQSGVTSNLVLTDVRRQRRGYDQLMAESEIPATPLAEALARVGDRWTLLVVEALLAGPLRFNDLADQIPGIAASI